MRLGILGLPQGGKTTLFEILVSNAPPRAPGARQDRVGIVRVPDERVDRLSEMYQPKKTTFATLEVVDSQAMGQGGAGGAKGPDLFAGVRNADALVLVVRAFEDPSVPHPKATIDPARDLADLEAEILLNDMAIVDAPRTHRQQKRIGKTADLEREEAVPSRRGRRSTGRCRCASSRSTRTRMVLRGFQLSRNPLLVVYNVGSGQVFSAPAWERPGVNTVVLPCADEREVAQLPEADRAQFREAYGISEDGLVLLVRSAYRLLGLISFLTAGEDEVRAWTIQRGDSAVEAAGAIHSDLAQGFVRAQVLSYGQFLEAGSESKAREKGGSGPRDATTGSQTGTSSTSWQ
jgi:ribosome-binding ATPase YchF (GTP1/OBG family)